MAAEGLDELVDEMTTALDAARHPEDGLDELAAAYLASAQANPRLFRLMFSPEVGSDRESPERPECRAVRREHTRLEQTIVRAIRMQAPGYLRDDEGDDARFAARFAMEPPRARRDGSRDAAGRRRAGVAGGRGRKVGRRDGVAGRRDGRRTLSESTTHQMRPQRARL